MCEIKLSLHSTVNVNIGNTVFCNLQIIVHFSLELEVVIWLEVELREQLFRVNTCVKKEGGTAERISGHVIVLESSRVGYHTRVEMSRSFRVKLQRICIGHSKVYDHFTAGRAFFLDPSEIPVILHSNVMVNFDNLFAELVSVT